MQGPTPPLSVLEPDARVQGIPEAAIQDIWAVRRFDEHALKTTIGQAVEIVEPGRLNTDSGPDFTQAHLRIESRSVEVDALDWTGDVEVHRTSGEWLLHRHHEDPAYNRVILHVVLLEDRHTGSLRRADGTLLPEIVLYPRLQASLRSLLHRFYSREEKDFFCQDHWSAVPESVRAGWLNRLGLYRARAKASRWAAEDPHLALDELIYRAVMRALGYAKNADSMYELARRIPLDVLRLRKDAKDVEALLFGVAGLLPELSDMLQTDRHSVDYVVELRDRFARLQQVLALPAMSGVSWKYFRLRPANFPTRRLAQAAALLSPATAAETGGLLHHETAASLREALESEKPRMVLRDLLHAAEPDPFWVEHQRFERRSPASSARIGTERADRILADAILPLMLLDALRRNDRALVDRVEETLGGLPAASDEITRKFATYGQTPSRALGSQGLHELYRSWCTEGRCLSCAIGEHVLSRFRDEGDPASQ